MKKGPFTFVGFLLTDELRQAIKSCDKQNRIYVEDPMFLEIIEAESNKYIGKRIEKGIALDRIEDTAKNVASLIKKVFGGWDTHPSSAFIMGLESEESNDSAGNDYTSLLI